VLFPILPYYTNVITVITVYKIEEYYT